MATYPYAWSTPQLRHPNDTKPSPPILLNKPQPPRLALLDDEPPHRPPASTHRETERVEHEFVLRVKRRPLLSLRCKSRAGSKEHKPLWFDGDVIEGGVQLMLHKPTHVEEITFRVRGRLAPPETGSPDIFWSTAQKLWSAPKSTPASKLPKSSVSKLFHHAGLAEGNHHWPIALQLPLQVRVPGRGGDGKNGSPSSGKSECLPLPPSFRNKSPSAVTEYEIMLTAYRGILREPYTLIVPFVFLPRSSPQYPLGRPHPSMGTLIIEPLGENETASFDSTRTSVPPSPDSPSSDTDQRRFSVTPSLTSSTPTPIITTPITPFLEPLPPSSIPSYISLETRSITVNGLLFAHHPATLNIRLLLPAPLIYPRGHPLRFLLVLQGDETMALDLVGAEDSVKGELEQRVSVHREEVSVQSLASGGVEVRRERTAEDSVDSPVTSSEVMTPLSPERIASSDSGSPGRMKTKVLEGIVHVPRETKPSFSFGGFVVEHVLCVQFTPACFTPLDGKPIPRICQSVQIVTDRVLQA
ncbi:hypothetical protein DACRYDRAFT_119434 [Dacryopinax primogenitus]|uniref:Arrestin-like N-terminal domain-containing protein n=1 Tax=Dacryopinax primogenitus (strain DJM 731) TaxID=1858805 RepID=M5FPT9_DACPD|nr:uncharacterized protein DACRYDRAFT_119434 [Dacryopinax primogenitus]EJT97308.1 hypothetical protein DACRYDRAFT_119434 [Dacryopinax primogenitus]